MPIETSKLYYETVSSKEYRCVIIGQHVYTQIEYLSDKILLSLIEHTRGERSVRDNIFIQFCIYDAFAKGVCTAVSIFSMKIP